MFAIIGNLLFHDLPSYVSLTESMLTIFKASAGIFDNEEMAKAKQGQGWAYVFILTYMLLTLILIINLLVGQLSSAYAKQIKNRNVLMLLETLSVREASEADDKYSASVSCPYPISILNLLFGTYILSVKNESHNEFILHLYFLPVFITNLILFIAY